jgi:acyl dehydratase
LEQHATGADLQPGRTLPELSFGPISRTFLALYACASEDQDPVHIDSDFAKETGFPDVIAHGMLSFGVLSRMVTQWCGVEALREFRARFVSITNVHDLVTCRGWVSECMEEGGERRARIQLVVTAQDGRETLVGEAVVAFD